MRSLAVAAPHADAPALVGIVNATPDSFSQDGRGHTAAVDLALQMVEDGADWVDVGGESTRPGAAPVPEDAELARVVPVITALRQRSGVPISVDTRKARVADAALAAGATMVNDVSGFGDPAMADVVRRHGARWVLMHMPHATGDMGWSTRVEAMPAGVADGCARVVTDLAGVVQRAVAAGVPRTHLVLDPGIGFGKSLAQNLAFLLGPQGLDTLGLPLFVGPSRKSFIGAITGAPVTDRLMGTAAAVTACVLAGAAYVRVHDVAEMRQVVDVATAIRAHQLT